MSNITGSINLRAFKNSFIETRKNKSGQAVKCVTIPLEPNYLSETDKGNVYVNVSAWPRKNPPTNEKDKSTHIVNHDPGKEVRDKLKSANEYPATLGNLTVWGEQSHSEQAPAATDHGEFNGNTDDLPF